jgi:hypothetical protein
MALPHRAFGMGTRERVVLGAVSSSCLLCCRLRPSDRLAPLMRLLTHLAATQNADRSADLATADPPDPPTALVRNLVFKRQQSQLGPAPILRLDRTTLGPTHSDLRDFDKRRSKGVEGVTRRPTSRRTSKIISVTSKPLTRSARPKERSHSAAGMENPVAKTLPGAPADA